MNFINDLRPLLDSRHSREFFSSVDTSQKALKNMRSVVDTRSVCEHLSRLGRRTMTSSETAGVAVPVRTHACVFVDVICESQFALLYRGHDIVCHTIDVCVFCSLALVMRFASHSLFDQQGFDSVLEIIDCQLSIC